MTPEWITAQDQFGLREVEYPVAFFATRGTAEQIIAKMDADGWYLIDHAGAIAAFQDKTPVVPFGNGITGRRHVVAIPVGEAGSVAFTAHVDKSLLTLHEMDKRLTPKFLATFKKVYGPKYRQANPDAAAVPAQLLVDLHSYPPDTESPYQPFDLVLLRVKGVTHDAFLLHLYRLLQSQHFDVGIVNTPQERADLITTAKRASPGTQVVLLEVNEKFGPRLPEVGERIAVALRQAVVEDNPGPVLLTLMGGVVSGIAGGILGHALGHYFPYNNPPSEVAQAEAQMYRLFHAFQPKTKLDAIFDVPDPGDRLTVLGPLTWVVYFCSKWNRPNVRYIHKWEKSHLIVGQDRVGNYWLHGKARVKKEGITDHPGPASWSKDDGWEVVVPKSVVYLGIAEEIKVGSRIIMLKRTALCTDAKGERLYLVPLGKGVRPSHPTAYRG